MLQPGNVLIQEMGFKDMMVEPGHRSLLVTSTASSKGMETVMEINELPKTVLDHVNVFILLEQELYGLDAVEGRSNGGEDQSLLQHCRS